MAQLPNLDVHDRPSGTIVAGAFAVQWLQDIIDFWYHMCPFSATITTATTTIPQAQDWYLLPSDFILDVRNGALVQTIAGDPLSYKRAVRVPLQKWLNRQLSTQKSVGVLYPAYYCIFGDDGVTTARQQRITSPRIPASRSRPSSITTNCHPCWRPTTSPNSPTIMSASNTSGS